jgi:raffinose/stachyose/melibiose transport system substrate-binding protein
MGSWANRQTAAFVAACLALGAASPAAAQESATLEVWLKGPVGTVNAYTEVAEEWNRLHPETQVTTTFMGDELVAPALLPALNAGTGPDIWEGGIGLGQPQSVIDAGHVLDLSPYYFNLGWDERIPPNVVTRTSSDGKLWSVGQSVQTTVMFYNKRIFEEMGLSVPTTWDEFIALEEALKAEYDTVVALPAGDGWPISHNQTALWGLHAGPDGVDAVLFGDGRWDDQVFVDATRTLVEQHEAGYFGSDALAVGYRDALASFFRGEIPMVFTGTFMFPDFLPVVGDSISDFGAFALPNPVAGQPTYPFESIAGAWYVNAASEHPDEAVAFLDFLNFSDFGRSTLLRNAVIPVGEVSGEGLAQLPQLHQEILELNDANRANGSVEAFLDTVLPARVSTVTYDGLQGLLTGDVSPEDFTSAIQAAWEEAKAAGETMEPGGIVEP